MLITGRISVVRALLYIGIQCVGAVAGTATVKILLPEEYHNNLGHTTLNGITEYQGLGLEFFLGFILVFTVFGVCDGNKPGIFIQLNYFIIFLWICAALFPHSIWTDSKYIAPLAIGLSVTVGHLATVKYTGSSMNPARSFGTAFVTQTWNNHWVGFVGHNCT